MEQNPAEDKSVPVSPEKTPTKLNILIVDDEPDLCRLLQRLIEGSSVASQVDLLETAADGQEAFDKISQNKGKYNIVLTDGQMPKMNGLELCKKIRESGEDIIVGLMSGGINGLDFNNLETQESVKKDYGITAFLPKPFGRQQFLDVLSKINDTIQTAKSVNSNISIAAPSSSSV